ncbi:tellurite resistance/C4-dicarboxylate transporter family protein [Kitasatospora herbaricolor]|uniref:Tellurite resistance/C4-dicarboxylate transporter family protein n=1 Tax=Kitasatospora herbaricolor TaxID=68217 RepID=A0ABZ1WK41_9ACTN|nr:tellurite resistance/C4-dicarboxylate transporter family protein [Kitasatospora herbaricolor]
MTARPRTAPFSPPMVRPAAGGAVLATGALSVGLLLIGQSVLSAVAFALTGALWLALALDVGLRLVRDRPRWFAEADTPPALTAVAATALLGTRCSLAGLHHLAAALLALAFVLWPGLLAAVARHWKRSMPGSVFLVCVATQALAVLAATLALADASDWLMWAALILFCLGLALYLEALTRFDFRQIWRGAGDHWIASGALAISALTGSKLILSPLWTGSAHETLRTTTLALLALALAWHAALLVAEVARPRLHYDIRRWSTVFPMAITAAATLAVSTATRIPWLDPLGRTLLWTAVAAWLLTLAGLLRTYTR